MIKTIKHKGLRAFYEKGSLKGIDPKHARKLRNILTLLETAEEPDDLNLPSLKMHKLAGNRKNFYSVWVNGNWRVTYRFVGSDIELVNYEDYH